VQSGLLYTYKRDKSFRPIVIINVEKMLASKIEQDDLVLLANFYLEFVINNCMIPSRIEDWTVIIDLNNVGVTQIPKSMIQALMASL